jgi:hypothetical protein
MPTSQQLVECEGWGRGAAGPFRPHISTPLLGGLIRRPSRDLIGHTSWFEPRFFVDETLELPGYHQPMPSRAVGPGRGTAVSEPQVEVIRRGAVGVIAVDGQAGFGKSSLLTEVARGAERQGVAVRRARAARQSRMQRGVWPVNCSSPCGGARSRATSSSGTAGLATRAVNPLRLNPLTPERRGQDRGPTDPARSSHVKSTPSRSRRRPIPSLR